MLTSLKSIYSTALEQQDSYGRLLSAHWVLMSMAIFWRQTFHQVIKQLVQDVVGYLFNKWSK